MQFEKDDNYWWYGIRVSIIDIRRIDGLLFARIRLATGYNWPPLFYPSRHLVPFNLLKK